ncbi:MAG TPA: hypothetical protein VMH31_17860 [Methylomirabilota bacterium]|nr:hypothetical protein [Methylomirabilota bacterium]
MKLRMIAVVLILALSAWLPAIAQQTGGAPATAPADSKACACCEHQDHQGGASKSCCHGKDGAADCCKGKDGTAMACCKDHDKGDQSAMNCCKGKDGKMCAKDGKGCCNGKNGKSCCGKDAAACNSKDGKPCCDAATGTCAGCTHS